MIFSHLLPFQPFLSFPSHLEPFLAIETETETDNAISRPMRGLKKLHPMAQTSRHPDGHGDYMTESAQWGQFSEKKREKNQNSDFLHIHNCSHSY